MTNKQIYEWLEEQDYPTTYDGWDIHRVYFKKDMPRILREFMDYCNYLASKNHADSLEQKSLNEEASSD